MISVTSQAGGWEGSSRGGATQSKRQAGGQAEGPGRVARGQEMLRGFESQSLVFNHPQSWGGGETEGESEAPLSLRAGQVPRGELTELTSHTPTHQAVCILEGPGDSGTLKSASPAPRWPYHLGIS